MPDIDSAYLKGLPSSDLYGDEDGFDMDIELNPEPTEEDELNYFQHQEYMLLEEYPHYSRSEAGYLCCDLSENPSLPQIRWEPSPEDNWF